MIIGLDLATRLSGWCKGDGSTVPLVGAWSWPQVADDIGELMEAFDRDLNRLIDSAGEISLIAYEAPILTRTDKPLVLRKIYGLGTHLEWVCKRRGIDCVEASIRKIKMELAGRNYASKDEMVAAAKKVGIELPVHKSHGREDAADAFGVWLTALRVHNKTHSAAWDRRLWSARGALV